ncbi:MAG: hypothetical protein PQJ60_07105, partial [Spirochaetales bacterium]|nr:hypothetical protein [Spirochaetales bacterium]
MDFKRFIPIFMLTILSLPLFAQVDFFWENEQVLADRYARFPQAVNTEEELLAVWQEFDETAGTVTFYFISSADGITWSDPRPIAAPVDYFWEDQVSLFSLVGTSSGEFHLAFHETEQTIAVYTRSPGEEDFLRTGEILSDATNLAPRLYEKSDGDLILFSTKSARGSEAELSSTLNIIFSERIDGVWTVPERLVQNEVLTWNFLPDFHSYGGRDYVVFQSLYTGTRITWQIYIQSRESGSRDWSEPALLTDRDESFDGVVQESIFWDNQRPSLTSDSKGLVMTWERHYSQLSPQIYLARLDGEGRVEGNFTPVTNGYRYNANPRYFAKGDEQYILWFDNRDGNQVVMT